MSIKQSELLQGAALVRLIKASKPETLRLNNPGRSTGTSTFRINDEIPLIIKVSKTPFPENADDGKPVRNRWQFTFTPREMDGLAKEKHVGVLVCGVDNLYDVEEAEFCFLDFGELDELLDLQRGFLSKQKALYVRMEPSWQELRVSCEQKSLRVGTDASDNWRLPKTEM